MSFLGVHITPHSICRQQSWLGKLWDLAEVLGVHDGRAASKDHRNFLDQSTG